jgi:hypothetical protein
MTRPMIIFAALFFGGALVAAYGTSDNTFETRWTAAQNALTVAHHGSIPEEKLHARALEILHGLEAK